MRHFLWVGLGGALGSILRYGVSSFTSAYWTGPFPLATLLINVTGCLAIGGLVPWMEGDPPMSSDWRVFLVVGILGGYTTFSAFGYETHRLLRNHQNGLAFTYVAASLLLGLAAVWLGRLLGGSFR
jgi:CrcB protein